MILSGTRESSAKAQNDDVEEEKKKAILENQKSTYTINSYNETNRSNYYTLNLQFYGFVGRMKLEQRYAFFVLASNKLYHFEFNSWVRCNLVASLMGKIIFDETDCRKI